MHAVFFVVPATILAILNVKAEVQCNKTYTWYNWAVDVTGQDPCQLASRLYGSCAINADLLPLVYNPPGPNFYQGPNSTLQNTCTCSYVMYNLMSACGDCQVGLDAPSAWLTYKEWAASCKLSNTGGLYPSAIPAEFTDTVPLWAHFSTEDSGDPRWSYGLSKGVAIGHFLVNDKLVAAAKGPPCHSLSSDKGLPIGTAFVGFTVGVLISLLAFLFYRKRRSRVIPPPTRYHTTPDNTPLHPLLPRSAHAQGTSFLRRILEQENESGIIEPYDVMTTGATFPPHPAVFPPRRGHAFPPIISVAHPSRSPSRQSSLASLNLTPYGYASALRRSQSVSPIRPPPGSPGAASQFPASPLHGPSVLMVQNPILSEPSSPVPPDASPSDQPDQPPTYRRKS